MKVFLSSTYLDLVDHRQAVINALERLGQQVGRMEVFGARPSEPIKTCLEEISDCDLFVGVYAYRYGYIPPNSSYSITEQEFQWAHNQRKPLFCYIVNEDYAFPSHFMESESNLAKLLEFKAHIRETLVVDYFSEPLDLAVKVATAIGRYLILHQELLVLPPKDEQEIKQREALITLLEVRKDVILERLNRENAVRERFLTLHEKNIAAIRKGEFLLSHLLTSEIHSLIFQVVMKQHSEDTADLHVVYAAHPGVVKAWELMRRYPLWAKSTQQNNAEEALSNWSFHLERVSKTAMNSMHQEAGWREMILLEWLQSEIQPIQTELMYQRRRAILEHESEARGVQLVRMQSDHKIICPHCKSSFLKGVDIKVDRCPKCFTYVELVEQPKTVEYQGHFLAGWGCIKCGCSRIAIDRFGFKCS